MTAKQKVARANFKKAVTDAQKLRKSNPKLTQAQALKQAFAANKKVGGVKKKSAPKKKAAPVRKKAATKKAVKKKALRVRKKAATKKSVKQTGTTTKFFDSLYQAKSPGKRKSKSGNTYYERRANRSDKGVLLGVDTNRYAMGNVNMSKLITEIAKENKLKADVINILKRKVKDYDNNYKSLLKDILYNGLQSGVVRELIYYSDTIKWYKKHRAEIKKMLYELMSSYGTNNLSDVFGSKWDSEDPFAEDTSNQNLLAWFSFEETAREIADRLGYEI